MIMIIEFFKKMFGKKNCTLCGKECGIMSRTKIKNDEFVCGECIKECSKYIDMGKLTKDEVLEHIEYMRKWDKLHTDVFKNAQLKKYPGSIRTGGFVFANELGLFQIIDGKTNTNRKMPEMFRYDQVASYEPYTKKSTATADKPQEITESGIKIKFVCDDAGRFGESNLGTYPHPFIEKELTICIAKSAYEHKDLKTSISDIIAIFNYIFGVNDNVKGLFDFGLSKDEKRQISAITEFTKGVGSILNAQQGDENAMEAAREQMQKTGEAMDDANTGGLSVYSRRADEAEKRAWGN